MKLAKSEPAGSAMSPQRKKHSKTYAHRNDRGWKNKIWSTEKICPDGNRREVATPKRVIEDSVRVDACQ